MKNFRTPFRLRVQHWAAVSVTVAAIGLCGCDREPEPEAPPPGAPPAATDLGPGAAPVSDVEPDLDVDVDTNLDDMAARAAHETGQNLREGAHAVGNAAEEAGEEIGENVREGVNAAGRAVDRTGNAIEAGAAEAAGEVDEEIDEAQAELNNERVDAAYAMNTKTTGGRSGGRNAGGAAGTASGTLTLPMGSNEPVLRVERMGGNQARVGEQVEYTIKVTNVSDHPVHGVTVHEYLPEGFRVDQSSVPTQRRQWEQQWQQQGMGGRMGPPSGSGSYGGGMSSNGMSQQPMGQNYRSLNMPRIGTTRVGGPMNRPQGGNSQQRGNKTNRNDAQQNQDQGQSSQQDRDDGKQSASAADGATDAVVVLAALEQSPSAGQQAGQQRSAQQSNAGQQGQQSRRQDARRAAGRQGQPDQQDQQNQQRSEAWNIGTLKPGESKTIDIVGVAQQEGTLRACVAVDYNPTLCTAIKVVKPELELQRQVMFNGEVVQDGEFFVCDDITIAYRLTNTGSGVTDAATIHEQLPDGLKLAEQQGNTVDREVGQLRPGETKDVMVKVDPVDVGRFTGSASATTGKLQVQSNEQTVTILRPSLDLSVDGPGAEYINRPVTYQVRVRNNSAAPALDAAVLVQRPDNVKNFTVSTQQYSNDGKVIELGDIQPGDERSFSVTFDGTQPGKVQMKIAASAYCVDELDKQIETELRGVSAVRLEMIDLTDPVPNGETTTYEVRVKNQGTAKDLNVTLQGELPDTLQFVEGQGDTQVQADGNQVTFAPVKALPPGAIATWRVKVRGVSNGKNNFRVQMTSDAQQSPVIEQEPTTVY